MSKFIHGVTFFLILCNLNLLSQTYTFTHAGSSGRYGPSQTQITNSYSNTNLSSAVTVSNGIQSWTVPSNGNYRIKADGAKGGEFFSSIYVYGASMQGDFTLTAGQVIKILVGQIGSNGRSPGGGGGSFVVNANNAPLIIAGGGGGSESGPTYSFGVANNGGNAGTSGMPGSNGNTSVTASAGGSLGLGGSVSTNYTATQGSGGGGFYGDGMDGNPATAGISFTNGGAGGAGASTSVNIGGDGGFGGGGGGDWTSITGSGGGGGYSGGGGGTYFGLGGGGGSYNSGTNQVNTSAVNSGNGYVTITKLSGVNIILSTPISCNGQSNAALTASVFGTTGPYTYSWSPGGSSSVTIAGLGPGTYTCRATDAASITYINTFTVTDPPLFTATTTQTNETCYGDANATAWLHISGGTGPYSFSWSPSSVGSSAPIVGGLLPGSYTCNAKDARNCAVSGTFLITQPAQISLSLVASSSVVCAGKSVTLTGVGVQTYTWLSGPVANGVPFSPTVTDTYLMLGSDAAGCTDLAYIEITVNPSPTVNISSSSTVCAGNSVNLSASGANTFAWNTLSTSNNITVSPTLTSVYSVTGTATNGCTDVATKTITLLNSTTVTANTSSLAICEGKSVTLTGAGAFTYTWSNGVINNVAFSPSATSVYSVAGTGACGTASAVITVTVNPLPLVTANATSTLVCTGSTVTLSGSGASTYTWFGGISNNTAFPINATNSYTVTGTDASGCQNTAVKTISTNPLPVVSASVSAATVCLGSSVTLNGVGANSYTWSSGISNNTPFAPSATGSYTVTGMDASGCQNSASVTVSIINAPLVGANSTSASVCFGNTVSLNGSGALTYTWSGTVSNNIAFTPTVTSTYTVFGSNACFTASNIITVTVNTLPMIVANASSTLVCQGSTLNLSGSGALSYTWSNGVSNNLPFSAINTATYTVTGTDANGCQNTAIKVVTVNPLPVVSLSATSLAICAGASISFNAGGSDTYTLSTGTLSTSLYPIASITYSLAGTNTLTGCSSTNAAIQSITVNALPTLSISATSTVICMFKPVTLTASGANIYTWTNGITNGISFNPTTTATYSVQGTNTLTGCTNSVSQLVTVNLLPSLSVSVSNATICRGASVVLTASGADTYNWTPAILNGVAFSPTVSNSYVVNGTNTLTGCLSIMMQTVIVNPLPVVSSSESNLAICKGDPVTLFAQGADTYTISNGVTTGIPFTPQSTLSYSITGTNSLTGCTSTNLAVQTITVNELPILNIVASQSAVCSGESLSLTVAGAATYSWNTNETSSTIVVIPITNSTFTVVGVDASGCSGQSFIVLDVADCVGLSHQTKNSELKIFPNPNNGEFYISGNFVMDLSIINELGQTVRRIQMTDTAETINLKGLENGIYFVIGQQGSQLIKRKVIVAR